MKNKHGAMLILWATAMLGMPGCDDGGGDESGAEGTTGMETTTTGDDDTTGDGESGPPTVIPPDPPADTGSTDDGMDGSSSGEPSDLSCDAYCDLYMDACQDFSEFANTEHCLDHCSQWPVGTPEDIDGDSLGCRTYHVTVAGTTDPELHCPHSGPSGDGVCQAEDAPTCELYCTRYFNNCEGDLNLWMDMAECMDTCAEWYPGMATDAEGHSIGCRAYYANLAAGDPEMHCPNAGPGGGDTCVLPGG